MHKPSATISLPASRKHGAIRWKWRCLCKVSMLACFTSSQACCWFAASWLHESLTARQVHMPRTNDRTTTLDTPCKPMQINVNHCHAQNNMHSKAGVAFGTSALPSDNSAVLQVLQDPARGSGAVPLNVRVAEAVPLLKLTSIHQPHCDNWHFEPSPCLCARVKQTPTQRSQC